MDEANSSVRSNLIILSPDELAKLGLNLMLSKKKKKPEPTTSLLSLRKHETKKNLVSSHSVPLPKFPELVNSEVVKESEDILDEVPSKKWRGRPRKISKPTSKQVNTFKNPVADRLKALLTKKAVKNVSDEFEDSKPENFENNTINSKKEKCKHNKSRINNPESAIVAEPLPKGETQTKSLQKVCVQSETGLYTPEMEVSFNNQVIETTPHEKHRTQSDLEQKCSSQKQSISCETDESLLSKMCAASTTHSIPYNIIEPHVTSALSQVSDLSTKDMKKEVIVLSNTAVSFTPDELKTLISSSGMACSDQRDVIKVDTDEVSFGSSMEKLCDIYESVESDEKSTTNVEQSHNIEISDQKEKYQESNVSSDLLNRMYHKNLVMDFSGEMFKKNNIPNYENEKDQSLEMNMKEITEGSIINDQQLLNISTAKPKVVLENSTVEENESFENNVSTAETKEMLEHKLSNKKFKGRSRICYKPNISREPMQPNESMPVNAEKCTSNTSNFKEEKLPNLSIVNPREMVEDNNVQAKKAFLDNVSNNAFKEEKKATLPDGNKKLRRRCRIVCRPKVIEPPRNIPVEVNSVNEELNESQLETENSTVESKEVKEGIELFKDNPSNQNAPVENEETLRSNKLDSESKTVGQSKYDDTETISINEEVNRGQLQTENSIMKKFSNGILESNEQNFNNTSAVKSGKMIENEIIGGKDSLKYNISDENDACREIKGTSRENQELECSKKSKINRIVCNSEIELLTDDPNEKNPDDKIHPPSENLSEETCSNSFPNFYEEKLVNISDVKNEEVRDNRLLDENKVLKDSSLNVAVSGGNKDFLENKKLGKTFKRRSRIVCSPKIVNQSTELSQETVEGKVERKIMESVPFHQHVEESVISNLESKKTKVDFEEPLGKGIRRGRKNKIGPQLQTNLIDKPLDQDESREIAPTIIDRNCDTSDDTITSNDKSEDFDRNNTNTEYNGKNSKYLATSTPLKKRGRKRKNSTSFNNQSHSEPLVSNQIEHSLSGRKRRKVNYFEMDGAADNNQIESQIEVQNEKSELSSEVSMLNTDSFEGSSNPPKKKRGRQKKIKDDDNDKSFNESLNFDRRKRISKKNFLECGILNAGNDVKDQSNLDSSACDSLNNETPSTKYVVESSNSLEKRRRRSKKNILECGILNAGIADVKEEANLDYSVCDSLNNETSNTQYVVESSDTLDMRKRRSKKNLLESSILNAGIADVKEESNLDSSVCDTLNNETPTPSISGVNHTNMESQENVISCDDDLGAPIIITKSKYTRHGKTTDMLNSIFSAAFKPNIESPNTPPTRGRPRSSKDCFVLDEEGRVTCVICESKFPRDQWENHNKSDHYNLAWCEGQDIVALDDEKVVRKKLQVGLKKKVNMVCYKCGHLSTTVTTYMVHFEECRGILKDGIVVCAVCNMKIERNHWLPHKMKHNNLAWRIGDLPLDLNNQNSVMSILNALAKMKKSLICEKCGITKKSVVGYISHRSQCGVETADYLVACEICSKKILPVSMATHLKMVHGPKEQKPDYFKVNVDVSLRKRKAAQNALSMLEKISGDDGGLPYFISHMDFKEHSFVIPILESELKTRGFLRCKYESCEFQVDSVEILQDHMNSCSLTPDECYTCTICLSTLSQDQKIDHLNKFHDIILSDDEYTPFDQSDDEDEKIKSRKKFKLRRSVKVDDSPKEINSRSEYIPKCIENCRQRMCLLFPKAYKFTFEFCEKNYNQPNLFTHLRYANNDWCLLDEELIEKYLPNVSKSCRVAWKKAKSDGDILNEDFLFKEFELFEHIQDAESTTIFCGGPISALAWLPTPYKNRECDQILAVAAYRNFDGKYSTFKYHNEPTAIQFWNFGLLTNKTAMPEPRLYFCLALDFGPVWNMEWCPSGCFDLSTSSEFDSSRQGVLAVSGCAPSVHIFAVPFFTEDQTELMYKVKPLLKLQLVMEVDMMKRETYPSKISWTKAQGHKLMAVGYTDGSVGIFDLTTDSPLLKFKDEDGLDVILPYKIIKAHKHCITALSLIHLNGGARWMFTGSFDRHVNIWDLNNDSCYSPTPIKRIISDGTWLTNWPAFLTASDEGGSVTASVNGFVQSHRNYMSEQMSVLKSQSTISSVSFNDWLNACLQSSAEGEIYVSLPSQLLYSYDNSKSATFRHFLNSTYLVDTTISAGERMAAHKKKQAFLQSLQRKNLSLSGITKYAEAHDVYEPLMYKEAIDKYGILFYDYIKDPFDKKTPNDCDMMKQSVPNLYPLQAITKISFNPNCFSSLYYATGYQAGFVRLSYLKFLEIDSQVNS